MLVNTEGPRDCSDEAVRGVPLMKFGVPTRADQPREKLETAAMVFQSRVQLGENQPK